MWIDVSVPLFDGMVAWGSDPRPKITQKLSIEKGDVCNLTLLDMSAHTGTHMDAPRHFVRDGKGMETLPLDAVMGPARVVEIKDPVAVRVAELEPLQLKPGERILFKSRNSERCWQSSEFFEDFVYISNEAAQYLVAKGVRTVGVDYLSIGGFHNDLVETHVTILGAGIWVIEGLNLSAIEPGDYELACLPLKILGSDGAPARAALRKI